MKKIAILYICTGKYSIFWEKFYEYCQENFLIDCEKHYFIFTDDPCILSNTTSTIHPIFQEVEKWPFPTLKRFEYFLKIEEQLKIFDCIMFMNSNLIVKKKIMADEILPNTCFKENLFVCLHPGFYNKSPNEFTYDRNPKSNAFIPIGMGNYYFAGGFIGGGYMEFIEMCKIISNRILDDLEHGIIALWHDESHLNKYMCEYKKPYKILSPAYLYPQGWNLPFDEKIMVIDKSKIFGDKLLNKIKNNSNNNTFILKIFNYLKGLCND